MNPEHSDAHDNLGIALAEQRRWPEALEAFHQAIRLNHADAEALYNGGLMLNFLRRHDEALEMYGAAVHARPDYAEARAISA